MVTPCAKASGIIPNSPISIGIGLSIVRKITELHKAELVIYNAMSDTGTRIIVRFLKHTD